MDKNIRIEHANTILDRIAHYQANCDFKSSIMLGFIGILVSCFFMGNFLDKLIHLLNLNLSCVFVIFVLSLIITTVYQVIMSLYYLLESLKGRLDPDKIEGDSKEGLITNSSIFFKTISQKSYTDFEDRMNMNEECFYKELLSQIYINSKICTIKFGLYNKAMIHIRYVLITLLLLTFVVFI